MNPFVYKGKRGINRHSPSVFVMLKILKIRPCANPKSGHVKTTLYLKNALVHNYRKRNMYRFAGFLFRQSAV